MHFKARKFVHVGKWINLISSHDIFDIGLLFHNSLFKKIFRTAYEEILQAIKIFIFNERFPELIILEKNVVMISI